MNTSYRQNEKEKSRDLINTVHTHIRKKKKKEYLEYISYVFFFNVFSKYTIIQETN
jgi:hypothetical protein